LSAHFDAIKSIHNILSALYENLADKAYPDWGGKQHLQMARNQFIQGVASASIQLMLMQEKPKTVEEALELVQQQLAVETAQRWLH